ncbi:hypothetical protein P168DRAFT_329601 [Aspergillus campestris IBT 28561]|uniref:Uncharacterized protein n=1 Tax=Aspergillus campestris (strain IBT 28561) TaxID=1392248 RepID=A0A2I1CVM0_ASPC2|nr:uncharacterized protein P168DRAFT_329601 [Aspergillus campestris IBT 28561]PKY01665.1 hypothetical protein P168DRAFT_329601 [Aspergillus campestris IBT 28561]
MLHSALRSIHPVRIPWLVTVPANYAEAAVPRSRGPSSREEEGEITYQADAARIMQRGNDRGEIQFNLPTFVYVHLGKADAAGNLLKQANNLVVDLGMCSADEIPLTNPMKHYGPHGIMRASYKCRWGLVEAALEDVIAFKNAFLYPWAR